MSIFLTKDEVAELTGRKKKSAQILHLRSIGMRFFINARGEPVIPRIEIDGVSQTRTMPARLKVTSPVFETEAFRHGLPQSSSTHAVASERAKSKARDIG